MSIVVFTFSLKSPIPISFTITGTTRLCLVHVLGCVCIHVYVCVCVHSWIYIQNCLSEQCTLSYIHSISLFLFSSKIISSSCGAFYPSGSWLLSTMLYFTVHIYISLKRVPGPLLPLRHTSNVVLGILEHVGVSQGEISSHCTFCSRSKHEKRAGQLEMV